MPDYLLVHQRSFFEEKLRPPLGEAWRRRSFTPCRELFDTTARLVEEFADRYHLDPDTFVLHAIRLGLPFDRASWRTAVGELLLVAAVEVPEFPAHLESILPLLAPDRLHPTSLDLATRHPFAQALLGSRDLTFGLATYRPDLSGYNHAEDVVRLAQFLAAVPTTTWEHLPSTLDDFEDEERAEELAFAREWFEAVADLYRRSAAAGQVIIVERDG